VVANLRRATVSVSQRPSIELGSFVTGEVPPPLEYQFLDADGVAIDLTGFTVATFQWGEYVHGGFADAVTETATVSAPATGHVTYVWDGDELDSPGEYAAVFFVNDGTTQYASILITWQVCLAVGVPPVV
jgi:hypothetical protein